MADPVLIARGHTADVFALDAGRVLRRYRDDTDVADEAAVMAHVGAHGYPVPVIESAAGPDLVMERLDGPTLAEALTVGGMAIDDGARLLADLHDRLHALPPLASDARILHLDLHPGNVILSARGPVVIDWCNTIEGVPELDVAMTALILSEVALDDASGMPATVVELMRAFVAHTGVDITEALTDAVARRSADPSLSPEAVQRLPRAAALAGGADLPAT